MCWARHICAGTETTQGSDEAPQASNETGLSATKPFRKLIQVSVQTRKTRLPCGSLVYLCSARCVRAATAPMPHSSAVRPAPAVPPTPPPRTAHLYRPRPHPPRAARTRCAHIARAIHPSRAAPTVPHPAVHPPHRACTHSPTRLLSVRAYRVPAPVPACLPTEVLKLQDFSFYQSISSFVVSLPNVSEKDVKGLLFRK